MNYAQNLPKIVVLLTLLCCQQIYLAKVCELVMLTL